MNSVPKITEILEYFKNNWTEVLDYQAIQELCLELGHSWRERVLSPGTSVQLFLLQILLGNTSCTHLRYFSELEFSASSYCDARQRIPLEVFEELVRKSAEQMDSERHTEGLWKGHRVWMGDGSGCSMPDTPELQKYFGQPGGQRKGCGFPVAHLLALMNCSTGILQKMLVSPLNTHDLSRAWELSSELEENDIVVYDRGFCSSAFILKLFQHGIHSVVRVQSSHQVDFRQSRKGVNKGIRRRRVAKLGRKDHLIEWHKPKEKPSWMSKEEFAQLPQKLILREISYTLDRKAFRSKKITLVTTLTDHKKYPPAAIAELYGMRWEIETNFRHLKISMKMDTLKCKTVQGVKKELCIFVLIYNMVRQAMIERSIKYDVAISRISFIDTLRWLLELENNYENSKPIINPRRRGRKLARVVKRRPKAYPRMTSKRKITIGKAPAEQRLMA